MSTSSFSPWFVKLTLNSVSGPYGDPVGRVRVERLVADLDGVDPGAMQAGRGLAAAVAAAAGRQLLAERIGDRGGLEPLDPGQELALLEPLGADVGVAQRVLDQRDHALAVDHVGRQEHLHRAGDLVDRAVGRLGVRAERRADLVRDLLEPVAAHLHRDQERALRRGHVARRGDLLGLLVLLLRLDLVAGDLGRQVTRARIAQEVEERLADLAVGVAHDRGDVAVVVLERVLLGGVAAAVDDEDQQRDDEDEPRPGARAAGPARSAGRGGPPWRSMTAGVGPGCVARRPLRRRTSEEQSPRCSRACRASEWIAYRI